MKIKKYWIPVVIITVVFAISLNSWVYSQGSNDNQPDDSNPSRIPEVLIPDQFQPDLVKAADQTAVATVYFTPQDENTSTTVLFLYNTSNITATVGIQTFSLSGGLFIDTSIVVPPASLVRICADTVSASSTSWQDVAFVNFTTGSTYAKVTLPTGVKMDGYVAWNGGSTYDPLQSVQVLPLRFSVDPSTVFLPVIQDG